MTEPQPPVIRSPANPAVRRLIRLRDNRKRRREKSVLVDGWRETCHAVDAGLQLRGLYVPESFALPATPGLSQWPASLREPGDQAEEVSRVLSRVIDSGHCHFVCDAVMEKICYGQSPRGVVAEFEQPDLSLDGLQLPQTPFILVLDQLEKPGNIGAVFRCAEAAGVNAVILCGEGADVFNPNAVRSSLGAVFHVPTASGDFKQVEHFLLERGIRALAGRVESSSSLWSTDLTGALAVILGSEALGLGQRWQSLGGVPIPSVRIPMAGRVDSLNVAVSAALIAFEAMRIRSV